MDIIESLIERIQFSFDNSNVDKISVCEQQKQILEDRGISIYIENFWSKVNAYFLYKEDFQQALRVLREQV